MECAFSEIRLGSDVERWKNSGRMGGRREGGEWVILTVWKLHLIRGVKTAHTG